MSDLEIGTLSGGVELKDNFTTAFDALATRIGVAGAALDLLGHKASEAGKDIGDGAKEASKHSETLQESLHKTEHASHEAAAQAAETKASFMEMFENPIAAAKEFVHELESEVLGALGALGIGVAAVTGATIGLSLGIAEIGKEGAKIIGVENSFNQLAKSIGQNGTELRESLSDALKHTVGDFEIMQSVNKALGAGVKLTTADMTVLGETARALGKATGTNAADGLDTLTSALTRGNTRALARLGITVNMQEAEKKFAAQLGVTKDQLNESGILEAKRQGIMDASRAYIEKVGVAESLWTSKIKQGEVAIAEWGEALAVAVARSPAISAAVNTIAASLEEAFGGKGQTAIDLIVAGLGHFADFVRGSVPYVVSAFEAVKSFWDWLVQLNDQFHITDTIIDGVKLAWAGLKQAFDFVRTAAQGVIDTWKTMPPWLQTITIRSVEATAGLYAFGKAVDAAQGPVERIVNNAVGLIGIFANLAQITGGTLSGAFALLSGIFSGIAAEFTVVSGEIGASLLGIITGPIGWTILAVTALGAAVYASIKYWDQLKAAVVYTWDVIASVTKTVCETITGIFDYVANSSIAQLISALTELGLKIAGWTILAIAVVAWKTFIFIIDSATLALKNTWTHVVDLYSALVTLGKFTFSDNIRQSIAGISLLFEKLAVDIQVAIVGIKWLNDHISNPLGSSTQSSLGLLPSRTLLTGVSVPNLSGSEFDHTKSAGNFDPSQFLKPGDALAARTKAALDKTEGLWEQYYSLLAKMGGDDLGAKLTEIDRWAEKEMNSLDASKIGYKAYYEEIAAISSVAFLKRLDANQQYEKKLTDEVLKADISRSEIAFDEDQKSFDRRKALDDSNLASYLTAHKNLIEEQNKLTMTQRDFQASQLEKGLEDAKVTLGNLGEGYRNTYDEIEATTKAKLDEIGVTWDTATQEWVHAFDFMWSKGGVEHSMLPPNAVKNTKSSLSELSGAFNSLANDITQISQISQGTFGNVIKDIGLAVKAAEAFAKALEVSGVGSAGPDTKGANKSVQAASTAATSAGLSLIPIVGAWLAVGVAVYSFVSALREANKEAEKLQKVADALHAVDVAFNTSTNFSQQLSQQLSDTAEDFAHITALNKTFSNDFAHLSDLAVQAGFAIRTKSGLRDLAGNLLTVDDIIKRLGLDATQSIQELSQAAHLSDILKELGGVAALTADQMKMVQTRTSQLFTLIALGGPVGQSAIKTMDDTLIQFTTDLTKSGGLVSQFFLDMASKAKLAGIELKQVAAFQAGQAQNAETGIVKALTQTNDAYAKRKDLQQQIADATDALKGKTGSALDDAKKKLDDLNTQLTTQQKIIDAVGIHSQAAAGAVAGALLGVISSQVANGMSFGDAIRAAGPGIEALRDQLATLGGGGGTAFDFLNQQISLFTDEVTGPALTAIEGYADGLVGLHNAGQLNQDTFAGITEQIGKTADALMAQGVSGPALLSAMQSPLQKIWELETKFGYAADAATQALVDQAVADGLVGEKHKSVSEQMLDFTERMTKALEFVAKAFGYIPPAAENAVDGVVDAFGKIPGAAKSATDDANIYLGKLKAPPINITWSVDDLPPGTVVEQPIYRAMGGPVGTDTVPAWLSKGEYVLSTNDVTAISKFGVSAPTSTSNSQSFLPSSDPYKNYPPVEIHIDARGAWFDDQGVDELSKRIQKPFWTAVHQNDQMSNTMAQNALKLNE